MDSMAISFYFHPAISDGEEDECMRSFAEKNGYLSDFIVFKNDHRPMNRERERGVKQLGQQRHLD